MDFQIDFLNKEEVEQQPFPFCELLNFSFANKKFLTNDYSNIINEKILITANIKCLNAYMQQKQKQKRLTVITISNNYVKVDLKSTEDYQLPSSAMRRGLKNHAQNPFSAMRRQRKYRTVLGQPKQWMIKIIHPNRIENQQGDSKFTMHTTLTVSTL